MAAPARTNPDPFEPLFQQEGDYLTLLSLSPEASSSLQFIAGVRGNSGVRPRVVAMLRDPDWRLHLVAAIAVLLSHDQADLSSALWGAVDQGSWVAPQLAVVLSMCDPGFVPHAKDRILAGCRVTLPDFRSSLERQILTGPASRSERCAKNLAALLHLVHEVPSETEWADRTSRAPELQQLLRVDRDSSDRIASHWAVALRDRFAELGLPLPSGAG